ncbi:NADH-quinone oxidoreductase subunit C [Candidatus Pelagibacter sp.]|nr:NADH-quinone oxidoreductase subunit C [Candidatus Pelagibacter sp.]
MINLTDLEKKINSELTTKIKKSEIRHDQLYLNVDGEDLIDVTLFIKNNENTKFRQLIDITVVDYPENTKRFKVVYLFLSHEFNQRIILSYLIGEKEVIPSLTSIYPAANWMEREVFDMYGVKFKDHPDLRRILTDYGFEGHPLRKDFPLTGHTEVRYSEDQKKVISEPVKLEQNYRNFDYESPWEGTKYIKKQTDQENDKKN